MGIASTLAPVVDFVFPPRCPLCGEALAAQGGLCLACWEELVIPGKPACASCARPFGPTPRLHEDCDLCRADPPLHDGIAAATLYNETSRKLVLAFKHGNRIALAGMMARLIAARLEGVGEDWLIVPVPLHRWRLWQRGFNQAAILGHELARLTGARLCVDALVRKTADAHAWRTGKARAREDAGRSNYNEFAPHRDAARCQGLADRRCADQRGYQQRVYRGPQEGRRRAGRCRVLCPGARLGRCVGAS
jgi:predicted amidophosphoribosyltransferase